MLKVSVSNLASVRQFLSRPILILRPLSITTVWLCLDPSIVCHHQQKCLCIYQSLLVPPQLFYGSAVPAWPSLLSSLSPLWLLPLPLQMWLFPVTSTSCHPSTTDSVWSKQSKQVKNIVAKQLGIWITFPSRHHCQKTTTITPRFTRSKRSKRSILWKELKQQKAPRPGLTHHDVFWV